MFHHVQRPPFLWKIPNFHGKPWKCPENFSNYEKVRKSPEKSENRRKSTVIYIKLIPGYS